MARFIPSGTRHYGFKTPRRRKGEDPNTPSIRLPVPSLWLDILQKIKASGYNCVSVYIDWHLIEGERGEFRADGIFALEPLFEAAKQAGLYVWAVRCGPCLLPNACTLPRAACC